MNIRSWPLLHYRGKTTICCGTCYGLGMRVLGAGNSAGLVMAIVTIMSPRTGKQVSTGIDGSPRLFKALPSTRHFVFHCWRCGHEHEWSRR
jgi:hypothetical protein